MPVFNLNSFKTIDSLPPIVFLFGKDGFSIDETLHKLLSFFIKETQHSDNIEIIDGEERDLNFTLGIASQFSMLDGRKLIVVKRFDSLFKSKRAISKQTTSELLHYIENPNPSSILILLVEETTEGKSDFSKTKFPYDIIIKNHYYIEFPMIYANKFPK